MIGVQSILLVMWTRENRDLERNWMNDGLCRACVLFCSVFYVGAIQH